MLWQGREREDAPRPWMDEGGEGVFWATVDEQKSTFLIKSALITPFKVFPLDTITLDCSATHNVDILENPLAHERYESVLRGKNRLERSSIAPSTVTTFDPN